MPAWVACTAALVFAVPGTAMAQTAAPTGSTNNPCYQSPSARTCGNQDPLDTDCSIGSYVANSQPVYYFNPDNGQPTGGWTGYIQNWYSPHCGTNWARYVDTTGTAGTVNIYVCVDNSSTCSDRYGSGVFPAWSNMVYSPSTTATAYAEFSPGPAEGQASA
ncbi:MAG TPA: hypothetical protein VGS19_36985 [Streptosporangiaceae bacterium]|nr:hypothetical protein [Streptosporangiaceae bacterium]